MMNTVSTHETSVNFNAATLSSFPDESLLRWYHVLRYCSDIFSGEAEENHTVSQSGQPDPGPRAVSMLFIM
jgi:hypothetical protein